MADDLLFLADGGGSNGYRSRLWKQQLQEKLCEHLGLVVTVCHYPRGCSKYNPVEHRLFSHISMNWAGKALRSFESLLGYVCATRTETGLQVRAVLHEQAYATGQSVSDEQMAALKVERHRVCPAWNYTMRPRTAPVAAT